MACLQPEIGVYIQIKDILDSVDKITENNFVVKVYIIDNDKYTITM